MAMARCWAFWPIKPNTITKCVSARSRKKRRHPVQPPHQTPLMRNPRRISSTKIQVRHFSCSHVRVYLSHASHSINFALSPSTLRRQSIAVHKRSAHSEWLWIRQQHRTSRPRQRHRWHTWELLFPSGHLQTAKRYEGKSIAAAFL